MGFGHGKRSFSIPISPQFHSSPVFSCLVASRLIYKLPVGLLTPLVCQAGTTLGPGEDASQERPGPVEMWPPIPATGCPAHWVQWHHGVARAANPLMGWWNDLSSRNRMAGSWVLTQTQGGPKQRPGICAEGKNEAYFHNFRNRRLRKWPKMRC